MGDKNAKVGREQDNEMVGTYWLESYNKLIVHIGLPNNNQHIIWRTSKKTSRTR